MLLLLTPYQLPRLFPNSVSGGGFRYTPSQDSMLYPNTTPFVPGQLPLGNQFLATCCCCTVAMDVAVALSSIAPVR